MLKKYMQIFQNKEFVTGIEYRDPDTNEPRDGSIIIPDDSPEAIAILEGHDFDIHKGKIVIKAVKVPEVQQAEETAKREAEKISTLRTKLAGKKVSELTLPELRDIVLVVATKTGVLPEGEEVKVEPIPAKETKK
jgi:hypothetical protein